MFVYKKQSLKVIILKTMLQFVFLLFGIVCGIEFCFFFLHIFYANFFSYRNSQGIYWVLYGFGSLMGFPLGLALQLLYKYLKNQFTKCSIEVFVSRFLGFLFGLGIAHLLCEPFYLLLISKKLLIIKPFFATLANVIFGYLGALTASIHSRYLLEFLTPKFVEALLIYQSIAKPATVRLLDIKLLAKHKFMNIFQTRFFEGSFIIEEPILVTYKKLKNNIDFSVKYSVEKTISILNQLKTQYPNKILLNVKELSITPKTSFKCLPIISKSKQSLLLTKNSKQKLNLIQLIKELRTPYIYKDILSVKVQKKGNRFGQGIGYLEDGTMVIIERGYQYIGQKINVVVKKIRQRSSGRILFTYPQITLLTSRSRRRKDKKRNF